jgi:hypothetical protein
MQLEEHTREGLQKQRRNSSISVNLLKEQEKSQYTAHLHLNHIASSPPFPEKGKKRREGGIRVCSINGLEGEQVRQFPPRSDPGWTSHKGDYADRRDKIVGVSSSPMRVLV